MWEPGTPIVLREVWDGRVWAAMPALVVEDGADRLMTFIPGGTEIRHAVDEDGRELRLYRDAWRLGAHRIRRPVLSFSWPDAGHAVLQFWDARGDFAGWYVNLETPLGRTPIGLDFVDHCLDVLIPPDRSTVTWKDEDELEEAVALGLFSPQEARAFRREGERAARRILEREPPFDRDWAAWRPDPSWPVPTLPAGWDRADLPRSGP